MSQFDSYKSISVGLKNSNNYTIYVNVLLENDNLANYIKLVITNNSTNTKYDAVVFINEEKYNNIYNNFVHNHHNLVYTNNNITYEAYVQSYYINYALLHDNFQITEIECENCDLIFKYTYVDINSNSKTNNIYLLKADN